MKTHNDTTKSKLRELTTWYTQSKQRWLGNSYLHNNKKHEWQEAPNTSSHENGLGSVDLRQQHTSKRTPKRRQKQTRITGIIKSKWGADKICDRKAEKETTTQAFKADINYGKAQHHRERTSESKTNRIGVN